MAGTTGESQGNRDHVNSNSMAKRCRRDELETNEESQQKQHKSRDDASNPKHWETTFERYIKLYGHIYANKMQQHGDNKEQQRGKTIKHKPLPIMQNIQIKPKHDESHKREATQKRCNRCCW